MYKNYFGFRENPFSIAPDPHYLYLSEMHQDALAHLQFGMTSPGGVILLTGEVGTGKTTLCRYFLEKLEPTAHVALVVNPGLSASELLATVCDEFRIPIDEDGSDKSCIDGLNQFLLSAHGKNQETLLIIDEAQNLDKESLEMLRLLTNLETAQHKLLKIFLLGQSELGNLLKSPDLTQFNQRVIGRFHISGLEENETAGYIGHRLSVAGGSAESVFNAKAIKTIHRLTNGIPRLINTLCDRALLGAFAEECQQVDDTIVRKAAKEIFGFDRVARTIQIPVGSFATGVAVVFLTITLWVGTTSDLFYLKLDSILEPAPPPAISRKTDADVEPADTVVEQIDSPLEQVEQFSIQDVSDQLSETHSVEPAPPIEKKQSIPEPSHVVSETVIEPAAPVAAGEIEEPGIRSIFIAPMRIAEERKQDRETKIIIKHIEIND